MTARDLYERFGGRVASQAFRTGIQYGTRWLTPRGRLNILIPDSLAVVGHVNAIEYDCVRDGKLVKARHVFSPGTRPALAVGEKRGQLFLLGTSFRFTDRGIVDFDARDRPIDYDEDSGRIRPLK